MPKLATPIPRFDNHEKFLSHIRVMGECWIYQVNYSGSWYRSLAIGGKQFKAHRVSMSIFKGDLNPELVIDHICRNKSCVNPDHLREVTQKINNCENSLSITGFNKFKTHCKYGHEYTPENTKRTSTGRNCRICIRALNNKSAKKLRRLRKLK
jgi:hypothetical protein